MTHVQEEKMQRLGIRLAKAHLSQLVRDVASGQCSLITDNGKLVAMIGPPPQDPAEVEGPSPAPTEETKLLLSDAAEFRQALLGVPFPLELNF
jgi:antitoxin (DNA-binding transcriptional repressor) of toxin-antitoxin stability system